MRLGSRKLRLTPGARTDVPEFEGCLGRQGRTSTWTVDSLDYPSKEAGNADTELHRYRRNWVESRAGVGACACETELGCHAIRASH